MILSTERVGKTYRAGTRYPVQALVDVTIEIPAGKVTLIRGPSGSGKTTLLCLLGTLLRPTSGRIALEGRDITMFSEAELARVEIRSTAVVNPLKERRIAAPTEEEIKAESGLGRSQVYANLQARKAELEKKIADLRSDLARLVATPTKPRSEAAPTNPDAPPPQP